LNKLIDANKKENIANRNGANYPSNEPYVVVDGKNNIRILGSPI
jgi:hypothetical protein